MDRLVTLLHPFYPSNSSYSISFIVSFLLVVAFFMSSGLSSGYGYVAWLCAF